MLKTQRCIQNYFTQFPNFKYSFLTTGVDGHGTLQYSPVEM